MYVSPKQFDSGFNGIFGLNLTVETIKCVKTEISITNHESLLV